MGTGIGARVPRLGVLLTLRFRDAGTFKSQTLIRLCLSLHPDFGDAFEGEKLHPASGLSFSQRLLLGLVEPAQQIMGPQCLA